MTGSGPDFRRFRAALCRDGVLDRVPLYDKVDRGVMSRWLGKPVTDLATALEFYVKAGYDYFPLGMDLWNALQSGHGHAPAGQLKSGHYSLYSSALSSRTMRRCVEQCSGSELIQ